MAAHCSLVQCFINFGILRSPSTFWATFLVLAFLLEFNAQKSHALTDRYIHSIYFSVRFIWFEGEQAGHAWYCLYLFLCKNMHTYASVWIPVEGYFFYESWWGNTIICPGSSEPGRGSIGFVLLYFLNFQVEILGCGSTSIMPKNAQPSQTGNFTL